MVRVCPGCGTVFSTENLDRWETAELERERDTVGLDGLHFRCYHCVVCGRTAIYLEVWQLPEETPSAYTARCGTLERIAHEVAAEERAVVVSPTSTSSSRT